MKLRKYQSDLIEKMRASFLSGHKRVLCVAGPGAGKTVLAAFMCAQHNLKNKDNYCWFLVHRQELVDQTIETLQNSGIPMDGIMVAMVQTVTRKIEKYKKPSMIIFDESQHSMSKSWKKIIDFFPDVPIVGLSGSPVRLDGKPLGSIFTDLCETVSVRWLIDNHYLADFDYFAPKVDFDEKIKGHDYDQNYIGEQFIERKIYGDVLKQIDVNRKTIIYCPNIKFSMQLEQKINEHFGSTVAVHFDGDTPSKLRRQIIEDFRNGTIRVLLNVDLVGEGFNVPDCDCCILLRPTQSLCLYIQQSMRCMRYKEGKRALIVDMVGNCYRHGLPDEDRIWSLTEKPRLANNSGEKTGDVLVRECGGCLRVYRGIDPICPYCGFDNKKTKKQIQEDEKAELEKVTKLEKLNKKREQGMAKSYAELVKIGRERGMKNPEGWAWYVWKNRNDTLKFGGKKK
jgi:superfamily II DNA or RNA helicase